MQFSAPAIGLGWIVALVVLVAVLIFGVIGALSKEWVLVIAAICAIRL